MLSRDKLHVSYCLFELQWLV